MLSRHDVVHHGIDFAVGVLYVVPNEVPVEARILRTHAVVATGEYDEWRFFTFESKKQRNYLFLQSKFTTFAAT